MRSLGGWQLDDFWYSPHTQGFLRKIKAIGAIALPDIQKRMTDGKYVIVMTSGLAGGHDFVNIRRTNRRQFRRWIGLFRGGLLSGGVDHRVLVIFFSRYDWGSFL